MDDDIRARARARRQARTGISLPNHTAKVLPKKASQATATNGESAQRFKTSRGTESFSAHQQLPQSSIVTSNSQRIQASNRPFSSTRNRRGELLSARQRIVIEAFANGLSNKDIKEILPKLDAEVTKETISNYFTNVINKIIK